MTTHQVTYQGPPSFAVRAATILADSDGVELTSAGQPEVVHGSDQIASLVVTVEGTAEAVAAAVESLQLELPPDATVSVHPGGPGRGDGGQD